MYKIWSAIFVMMLLASCGTKVVETPVVNSVAETVPEQVAVTTNLWDEQAEENTENSASSTLGGNVEIVLSDKLDGILSEYCLDIAGGNQDVDPANGLQVHTCYSYKGELGTDQVFDTSTFADNSLSMPIYDVCVSLSSLEAGAEVELSDCANATAITFTGNGTISPVDAPEMCFTASEDSRTGKGSQHQIRDLTLETCDESKASYQNWEVRSI